MNASLIRRTPTVADSYGPVLTLAELLVVLRMSRTTAKRRMEAGTFPIPALPRRFHEPYRFAAIQVDRFLARAMESAR
jgi:predicted DNA-binding transcriptional regulator AlpA